MTHPSGIRPRWPWAAAGVVALGAAVYAMREALTPIFFAFLIAYFLDPLVDRIEARGLPRAAAIAVLLALTLLGLALIGLLVVPVVVRELVAFSHELPAKVDALRATVEPWLAGYGIHVPHSFEELRRLVSPSGDGASDAQVASRAAAVLEEVGQWVWGRTSSALAVAGTVLVVPVFAFYLLYDFDRMIAGIRDLVPWRWRPFVVDVAREIDQVLGQFVRGQLLVMLVLAILYSVAYSLVGVRLAIPIGIVAGLLSFIPYVGGASALVLALLMCALAWDGWWQIVGVVVSYTVIQILEGFVITPRIVGDKVGLPAVWVLVALLLGGELLGFLGVLLAVPLAAIAKIFVVRALAWYRQSAIYREGGPALEGAGPLRSWLEQEGLPDAPEIAAEKRAVAPAPAPSEEAAPASETAVQDAGESAHEDAGDEEGDGDGAAADDDDGAADAGEVDEGAADEGAADEGAGDGDGDAGDGDGGEGRPDDEER